MKYSIKDVFDMLGEDALKISEVKGTKESIEVEGFKVYRRSMRYATFYQKGCKCVICGKEGAYFQLDPDECGGNIENRRHFNLYAEDGTLMTKDHILPKKWGGKDTIDNFQTMCKDCNETKGSQYEHMIDGVIAIAQDNPESIKQYVSLEAAIYDTCNNNRIFSQGGKPSTIARKSINVAIKIMNAIDKDIAVYGRYWKHAPFKVEGKPYDGGKDNA